MSANIALGTIGIQRFGWILKHTIAIRRFESGGEAASLRAAAKQISPILRILLELVHDRQGTPFAMFIGADDNPPPSATSSLKRKLENYAKVMDKIMVEQISSAFIQRYF